MDARTLPTLQGHRRGSAGKIRLIGSPPPQPVKPAELKQISPTPPGKKPAEFLSFTHDGLASRLSAIQFQLPPLAEASRPMTAGAKSARLFSRSQSTARPKAVLPNAALPPLGQTGPAAKVSQARRAARASIILQAALDEFPKAKSNPNSKSPSPSPVLPKRQRQRKKVPESPDNTASAAAAVRHAARHCRPLMTPNTGQVYDDVFGGLDPGSRVSKAPGGRRRGADAKGAMVKPNMHRVFTGIATAGQDSSSSESESDVDDDWDYAEMVTDSIKRLKADGVPVIPIHELIFGCEIDSGSFGVVREAHWISGGNVPVAVKTSVRDDEFDETLELFELEARMACRANGTRIRSDGEPKHIVKTYGVCYDVGYDENSPPILHLVMEILNCHGDIHNEIHREDHWECIRDRGKDTGKSVKTQFIMTDRNDVWGYTMPHAKKIEIALGLARAMRELRDSGVIHCDIKPANTVLHRNEDGEKVVKLIDFGEANILPDAKGDIAGTPGYMAPEMEANGDASCATDMYSAGVYLIELWVGWIGPLFDEYNGASSAKVSELRAMRAEIANALSRIERIDPKIAAILRRCVSPQPDRRPSPLGLIKAIKRVSGSASREHGVTNTGRIKTARRRTSVSPRKR